MQDEVDRRSSLGVMLGGVAAASASAKDGLGPPDRADATGSESGVTIQQTIAEIKRSGAPGGITVRTGKIASRQPIVVSGDFHGGLTLQSNGGELVGGSSAILKLGNLADPGPEHRINARISGINLTGPGKVAADAVGASIENTADVFLADGTYRGFSHAIRSTGGLLWDAYNLTLRDSGYGLYAVETSEFAPNSINLYSTRIVKCDRAVFTRNNPNGVLTFWGGEIEGNNESGDDRDQCKVVEHKAAGTINYIGTHFESNPGQYNLHYSGADGSKNLMMLGCQVIAGAAEQVHVHVGRGSFVASRITSGGKLGIVFGAAASGTVIDCEADVSGPGVGNVVALRHGRLAFGTNPTPVEPLISATAAAVREARGVVARWHGDSVTLQFCDATGRPNGHFKTSMSDHSLHNGNAQGGWVVTAGARSLFRIGRGGAQAIEGGSPNDTLCGTGAVPWAGGFTQTAFKVTSDRRAKRDIRAISERERAVAQRCKELLRAFRLKSEFARDGDGAITHYGVIAQDIIAAFAAEGLDALATGVVHRNTWRANDTEGAKEGAVPLEELFSVNYEQLYALMLSTI